MMVTVTSEASARSSSRRVKKMRELARVSGLCNRCCKLSPAPARLTCEVCSAAAKARVASMRERNREQRLHVRTARGYEAAGDMVFERFAYVEAIAQFEL